MPRSAAFLSHLLLPQIRIARWRSVGRSSAHPAISRPDVSAHSMLLCHHCLGMLVRLLSNRPRLHAPRNASAATSLLVIAPHDKFIKFLAGPPSFRSLSLGEAHFDPSIERLISRCCRFASSYCTLLSHSAHCRYDLDQRRHERELGACSAW